MSSWKERSHLSTNNHPKKKTRKAQRKGATWATQKKNINMQKEKGDIKK